MLAFPHLEITQETLIGRSGFESCHLHTSIFFVQFFFLAFLVNGDSHKKRFLRLLELHRLEKLEKFCYSTLGIFCADNLHERLFLSFSCKWGFSYTAVFETFLIALDNVIQWAPHEI